MFKLTAVRFFLFVVFISLVACFIRALTHEPQLLPSVYIDKPLPIFKVPLLGCRDNADTRTSGAIYQKSLDNTQMKGSVVLLNVWASWCHACMEEQDFLNTLSEQGIIIYGLNYKDDPLHAKAFLSDWGNPYYKIGQDTEGHVAMDLGVYGAPETFLIDPKGIIRYRHVGILTANVWKSTFLPLIQHIKEES